MKKAATIMLALALVSSAADAARHHGRGVPHGHAINAWGGSHHLKLR